MGNLAVVENKVEQIQKSPRTKHARYVGDERLKAITRTEKICNKCGILKPLGEFREQKNCLDGHVGQCKSCHSLKGMEWSRSNPEKCRKIMNSFKKRHPYRCWASGSLAAHRFDDYILKITVEELEYIAKNTPQCPICGHLLDYNTGKGMMRDNSPSLDRVDNGHVLDKNSIMIICQSCNRTKGARTFQEFIDYCANIAKF